MVTFWVLVFCVVVWVAVCIEVAAVVVIMFDRVDVNLLCEGRFIVGEMGLCLIC